MPYTPKDVLRDRRRLKKADVSAEWGYRTQAALIYLWDLWDSHEMMVAVASFILWCIAVVVTLTSITMAALFLTVSMGSMTLLAVGRLYVVSAVALLSAFTFILISAIAAGHLTAIGMSAATILLLLNGVFRYAKRG